MDPHPYANAPSYRLWRQAMAGDVSPAAVFPFRVAAADRIVSAGSCFAQHMARQLRARGFNYLVTERAHPVLDADTAEAFNYGVYSARYGNVYTARQLLQLFRRAHGVFRPAEDVWAQGGVFIDPYRPLIQPGGFASREELLADRVQHFAAVRRAFAACDVFVFTLGLTEAWESAVDGAVFPVCPGTAAGVFDAARHRLRNFGVDEVAEDVRVFVALLRERNAGARVVLTVSPVPLVATAEDRHVLEATTYSKAVLRVAADAVAREVPGVGYFPAYEIVTGPHADGRYFSADRRSVTEEGVAHVMRVFFARVAEEGAADVAHVAPAPVAQDRAPEAGEALMRILCDEESLDPDFAGGA